MVKMMLIKSFLLLKISLSKQIGQVSIRLIFFFFPQRKLTLSRKQYYFKPVGHRELHLVSVPPVEQFLRVWGALAEQWGPC